jgi:hypothetical protein
MIGSAGLGQSDDSNPNWRGLARLELPIGLSVGFFKFWWVRLSVGKPDKPNPTNYMFYLIFCFLFLPSLLVFLNVIKPPPHLHFVHSAQPAAAHGTSASLILSQPHIVWHPWFSLVGGRFSSHLSPTFIANHRFFFFLKKNFNRITVKELICIFGMVKKQSSQETKGFSVDQRTDPDPKKTGWFGLVTKTLGQSVSLKTNHRSPSVWEIYPTPR